MYGVPYKNETHVDTQEEERAYSHLQSEAFLLAIQGHRSNPKQSRGFSRSEVLCLVLAGNAREAVSHTSQQWWHNAARGREKPLRGQLPWWG